MNDKLNALAEAAGVAPRWQDFQSQWHEVAPDSLRAVLGALGLPATTAAEIADSNQRLAEQDRHLPPLLTATTGQAIPIAGTGRYTLQLENGARLEGRLEHGTLPPIDQPGYHQLEFDGRRTTLAVAPRHGYTVEDAAPGARPWALAVQLYALRRPNDGGLGDFRALQDLVEPAARLGAAGIAISPVHAQFSADVHRFSPYSPSSRIQLNVLHTGLDLPDTPEARRLAQEPLVDWPAAAALRLAALRTAFEQATPGLLAELAQYRATEGDALENHARFETLHSHQFAEGRWHWREWPKEYQSPDSPAVQSFAAQNAQEVTLNAFMQFLADRSLQQTQAAARAAGMPIGLIADLAVGADSGGSQGWSRQAEIIRGMSIGAPPDLLSTDGQSWGLAAFSPLGLRQNGYRAFIEMLRNAMRHAGGVRIDHALGLARLWLVPDGASAREGAYMAFPLNDLLRLVALESHRHRAIVLGEDLGTIPEGFQDRLAAAGTLGMRVLWFERYGPLFTDPRSWTRAAAAMTSTHDLPPSQAGGPAATSNGAASSPSPAAPTTKPARNRTASPTAPPSGPPSATAAPPPAPSHRSTPRTTSPTPPPDTSPPPPATSSSFPSRTPSPYPNSRTSPAPWTKPTPTGAAASPAPPPTSSTRRASPPASPLSRKLVSTDEASRRHRPPPIPQGLHPRRRRKTGPLLRQARHQPLLRLPLLTARAGSTHGYDIVDHNSINPELGGEPALESMVRALRAHDMGLILDIVPNHMGVGGNDNAWWLDVLEWGRASPYAEFFDIDWDPPDATLRGRMLAPFLGSPYGECLAKGELVLTFDQADGRLFVAYHDHRFPINPRDYASILLTLGGNLESPARLFADLPPGNRTETRHAAVVARHELLQPEYQQAIAELLRTYDAKTPTGLDRLHRLLERQAYRLAWWRAATDEINWRRFFDVNGLAGVRVEIPDVFEATHNTVFRLYEQGLIDGVRIDHVDGLANPRDYCRKLRRRLDALTERRPPELRQRAVLWIEKILFAHERLAGDWMTDGTTGYDFMNDAAAVLHDPAGEAPLTKFWTETSGRPADFEVEAQAARRQILRESLASELFNTAAALHRVARRDLATRDYTLTGIRAVLTELLVHFHTYRIYAGPGGISEPDQRAMDWAMAGARRTVRAADRELLELVAKWVTGVGLRDTPAGTRRQEWQRAMVRFQQLSAPTAAKSVEDTAFYRYNRLISRNEVGSEPSQFALSPAGFHAANKERQKRFPGALLATATHDHKRGEDTRIRLAVLSTLTEEWETAAQRWLRLNTPLRRDLDGPAPDPADELMLYQTLVAAWPLDLSPEDADGLEAYRTRVGAWLQKALREAKRHSGWAAPNEDYEAAAASILAGSLDPARPVAAEIAALAARIAPYGAINGLSQLLLRLTSPGIPDLYQGTENWDLSLVDPDNRRPVDFPARASALTDNADPATLLATWHDGRVKQAILHRTLTFRAAASSLFTIGAYTPLKVEGPKADNLLAFARAHEGRASVTVVTRCPGTLPLVDDQPLVDPIAWGATKILIPRNMIGRKARGVLASGWSGELPARIAASVLMGELPVALLEG